MYKNNKVDRNVCVYIKTYLSINHACGFVFPMYGDIHVFFGGMRWLASQPGKH